MPVKTEHRGLAYVGRTLGARAPSLFYHLVQRVLVDGQWGEGTTESHYLADLHLAVGNAAAQLAIYQRRGGHIAIAVAPTDSVVPLERQGWRSFSHLLVVYSTDRGMIVTGYQFSDPAQTGIPAEARWLK